ncbi:MAG: NAD(P)-binding domain-containing protein [Chloroflexi bacterium]|nr:NAD(P)-binding domain-containing protein [Chloroflexota bacterium]
MEFDDVRNIAVIGAGNIGHGIALGLALAGYQVRLNSTTEASLHKGYGFQQVRRLGPGEGG